MRTMKIICLLAAVAAIGPSHAVAATERAPLAGRTVVHWSGVKGIQLETHEAAVTLADMHRLHLTTSGEAAFVAIVPHKPPPADYCISEQPRCDMAQILSVKAVEATSTGPSLVEPPSPAMRTDGEPLDLYLLSDGDATLTLEPAGIPGSATYDAGGSIAGALRKLPIFCPTAGCDPASGYGSYAFGGSSFDLGSMGYVAGVSYGGTASPGEADSFHLRTCHYPNPRSPEASAAPADHRYGCDPAGNPSDPGSLSPVAGQTFNQVGGALPAPGGMYWDWFTGAGGVRYVGFHAGAVGPFPAAFGGYGIWLRYGIGG